MSTLGWGLRQPGGTLGVRELVEIVKRREKSDVDGVVEGLRAQFERASHFEGDFDPVRAVEGYRRVVKLLSPRIAELRVAAGLPEKPPPFAALRTRLAVPRKYADARLPTDRVYTFWDSPVDQAPPLVQACFAQLLENYPNARILDGKSARELIDIPDRIADLLEETRPAHFTDYVRTALLDEHGGMWVDATTWIARDLGSELRRYLRSGTVYPRWTGNQIANWFIVSQPGTPIISLMRRALEMWWETNDDLPDYFLYHRIFDVLVALVPEFRGQWKATPALSSTAAHLLQLEMMQQYRASVINSMLDMSPLQKLSYKYDYIPEGSVLEHLITRSP